MPKRIASLLAALGVHHGLSAQQRHDVVVAVQQSAPAATVVGGAKFLGYELNDMVAVATLAFLLGQMAYLAWKWMRDARREEQRLKDRKAGRTPEAETENGELL